MGIIELMSIGVGLAMDAFAVSICKGLQMKKIKYLYAFIIALFFGVFQAVMPLIGWLLGKQFEQYITSFDHWIAFGLLAFLGGKMIIDVIKPDKADEIEESLVRLDYKELFLLAIATSIDALAVGITFAFFNVNIIVAILIIGIETFVISFAGVFIGHKFGSRFEKKAELAGGIILILIGVKILIEHLLG